MPTIVLTHKAKKLLKLCELEGYKRKVAELVARKLDGFVQNSVDIPRIVRRVQLPAFEYDPHHTYVWPRSSSVDAGSLMFRAICELGSRSA